MILQGNQRGGARDLANHLLKDENEHVEVHEIRGFVSNDLHGAFHEAYAMSKGTRAKQFLYSLSLNPPANEKVSTQDFKDAIGKVENTLNLKNQPRAIVFHEKKGRRHCHVVWSRIDAKEMKAVHLPHTKRKLMKLSRDLYIKHGWQMPRGMIDREKRSPLNMSFAKWQQAKRLGKNPRAVKQDFQDAWTLSDNKTAFASALRERGYVLAKGDRRGFVALDHQCNVFSVSKWVGIKAKDVRAKLGTADDLLTTDKARDKIANGMIKQLDIIKQRQRDHISARQDFVIRQKADLKAQHKQERETLEKQHTKRQAQELQQRQDQFRKGLMGLWDRITGRHRETQKRIEAEAYQASQRDQKEKDALIFQQLAERQKLEKREQRLDRLKNRQDKNLSRDVEQYQEIKTKQRDVFDTKRARQSDRGLER